MCSSLWVVNLVISLLAESASRNYWSRNIGAIRLSTRAYSSVRSTFDFSSSHADSLSCSIWMSSSSSTDGRRLRESLLEKSKVFNTPATT